MRDLDVLTNIRNHNYAIGNYPLTEAEAYRCMAALKEKILHDDEIIELRKKIRGEEK